MPDILMRAFALIGVFTIGYHLQRLSDRIASRAARPDPEEREAQGG